MMATHTNRSVSLPQSILPDAVSPCQAKRSHERLGRGPRAREARSSRGGSTALQEVDRGANVSPSTLIALASHLAPPDRELVLWILSEGRSCAQASALLKASERSVQRRVRRLVERMSAPEFAYSVRQIEHGAWDRPTREVARRCVLLGGSVREAAKELGMTQHAVRARRAAILATARGVAGAGAVVWKQ